MPLTPGKSPAVVSKNISEFHKGPTFQHTADKFGKARADKQAVAVALHTADKSKGPAEDPKASIARMDPAKLHQHMQDAAAGKYGPEAQQSAQQAMQTASQPGEPDADDMAAPARRSPFSGDNDMDDQPAAAPVSRGSMFSGGR